MNRIFKALLLILLGGPALGLAQQAASNLESLLAAARHAQGTGDYAAAAEDYRKAVALSPDTPELWANLGLMQQETGDIAAASNSFVRANRLNPKLYVPNLFLGIDYAHSGHAEKAIPFLLTAQQINKADPQAPLALGRAYVTAGNFTAAAAVLDRATVLDPKLGAAWFTAGIARLDQVEVDSRTMSDQGKTSAFAEALYAESLAKQSRFGEAERLFKSQLDSLPQPPCLRSELGFALIRERDQAGANVAFAAERSLHPECSLALLGQARIAIDRGDNDQAANLLTQLWNRDHGFFTSNVYLLLDGLSNEKAAAAISVLSSQDSTVIPDDLRSALLSAFNASSPPSANEPAGNEQAAGAALTAPTAEEDYAGGHFEQCALRLQSGAASLNAGKLRLLAACAYFAGDSQRASSAATRLRALEPHSLEALYWSIKANERLALQSLARFQQLDPNSASNHILLADILRQLERFDDAQAEYLKALSIAPDDPAAMLGLATTYLNNNNPGGAVEIAQKALVRTPDDPELNLVVAEALITERNYTQSEPYLIKSLQAKPQMRPRIHALLGKVYAETGRTQEAIEQLKLGASSDEDGSGEYLLARLYRQTGDMKDATEALNRMKFIKQQRDARGVKKIEDPALSPLESVGTQAAAP